MPSCGLPFPAGSHIQTHDRELGCDYRVRELKVFRDGLNQFPVEIGDVFALIIFRMEFIRQ